MIGIHIRKTDGGYTNIDWESIDILLIKKLELWLKKDDKLSIFLATDCEKTSNKYKTHFNDRLLSYIPETNKFHNNKFNVISGIIDIYLLSKCNKIIIGTLGSSFSITAGLMGNTPLWLIKDENSKLPDYIVIPE
jgi:hypothetical protein